MFVHVSTGAQSLQKKLVGVTSHVSLPKWLPGTELRSSRRVVGVSMSPLTSFLENTWWGLWCVRSGLLSYSSERQSLAHTVSTYSAHTDPAQAVCGSRPGCTRGCSAETDPFVSILAHTEHADNPWSILPTPWEQKSLFIMSLSFSNDQERVWCDYCISDSLFHKTVCIAQPTLWAVLLSH